ncbi:hypothetical protein ACI2IP_04545 [Microbacterium sp. NPDC090218]
MGVLYDYFSAPNDEEAAKVLAVEGGPGTPDSGYDAVALKGIDPIVQLGTLEALLTETPYDDVVDDPRSGAMLAASEDYDQLVVTLTAALVSALAAADDEALAKVAVPWSQTDEFGGAASPEELTPVLKDLAALARRAESSGALVYCWVCV